MFLTNTLATLSPNPPKKLCSSAVTTHPVFETDFIIAFSSKGFIVCMFITSAETPCLFKIFEASKASQTKWPVAIIVTSLPSSNFTAFPISKT